MSSWECCFFSPPVKHWAVWGTVYQCIIKAGPLRVINTLQKSSAMPLALLKQSLVQNSNGCTYAGTFKGGTTLLQPHVYAYWHASEHSNKLCMPCTCMEAPPVYLEVLACVKLFINNKPCWQHWPHYTDKPKHQRRGYLYALTHTQTHAHRGRDVE